MKNKRTLLAISLSLVLVIAVASVFYNYFGDNIKTESLGFQNGETETVQKAGSDSNSTTQAQQSNTAPNFKMTDKNGNTVTLSSFKGKPIVLNFWASWCGPCKSEMPHFDSMYKQYKDEINFVMVNLTDNGETIQNALSYINENGYSFPVYFDNTNEGALNYGVYSIPSTYFIDANGDLVVYAQGAINEETLKKGIDMIYKK